MGDLSATQSNDILIEDETGLQRSDLGLNADTTADSDCKHIGRIAPSVHEVAFG